MDHVKIHRIIRSRRKTIALVVSSDATLTIRAPLDTTAEYIESLVRRKSAWIKAKVAVVKAQPQVPPKKFANGESFLYLGDLYRLRIVEGADTAFVFQKEFLLDRSRRSDARRLLLDWYKKQAECVIRERVRWHAARAGVAIGSVRITDARRRWGSSGRKSSLNFSWRLIMAPRRVIDAVVVHELAHISEQNHSPAFWRIVAVMSPRYDSDVSWLEKNQRFLQV